MENDESLPVALKLFDMVMAINRLVLQPELSAESTRQIAADVEDKLFMTYHAYCIELEEADTSDMHEAGWGACRPWVSESPILCWHVRTAIVLNENVIRRPISADIYHHYSKAHPHPSDWTNWTFAMMLPGLMLNLRDADSCSRLTEHMLKVQAGFALRSCLGTLAKRPRSMWYGDHGDRHSLIRYVNSLIETASRSGGTRTPTGLWSWVRSALDDHPEHADLASRLKTDLPADG